MRSFLFFIIFLLVALTVTFAELWMDALCALIN